jgi:trans-aconitate 2-methyltransferase
VAPRDWNAGSYERVSAPLEAMGREVLDRLDLRGDERVLDAGCGTGRVTAALVERLPRGEVVAVDGSPAMVEAARERLGDAVELHVADLAALALDPPVDAILSTATFHWIADHERLFARLAAALRPGGKLVAQCGGAGNIESIRQVLGRIGDGWLGESHFETAEDTAGRLANAGFTDIETWLSEEPTEFEPGEPFETYLRTVVLGAHVARLPVADREAFVHEVASRLDAPRIDYVRLNILARRPGR